jgi:hypothetical protein
MKMLNGIESDEARKQHAVGCSRPFSILLARYIRSARAQHACVVEGSSASRTKHGGPEWTLHGLPSTRTTAEAGTKIAIVVQINGKLRGASTVAWPPRIRRPLHGQRSRPLPGGTKPF